MKKRFRSGVNIHRTRSFPGADIGSDHDLVMMTFQVRLKKVRKPNQPRLRFGLNNIYSQKNTYVNTTQMVQDLTVSATLIYKSSPED